MGTKFIFVTGGVVSSLGKGITASTIGLLLKAHGLKVFMLKFDPYLNIDPSKMSPFQHGEVYVTEDGAETDLDLGHYERFIDENLTKESSVTAGKIYKTVLDKERKGEYLGATIQVVPHITNEIKRRIEAAASKSLADVVIIEIGGTVGDIESTPFLEAIRQFRLDKGYSDVMFIHATLVPYLKMSDEHKTKPTQHSVKELQGLGIQPDCIVLRSETSIGLSEKEKISLFCNVPVKAVFEAVDQKMLLNIITAFKEQNIDNYILERLNIVGHEQVDISNWTSLIEVVKSLNKVVKIGLVAKCTELHDAYLSVAEALTHAGYNLYAKVEINWIDATDINEANVSSLLSTLDGVIVPDGSGARGVEGILTTIKYVREHNIPFLGICYGMHLALIEYANNVLHIEDCSSSEIDENCLNPIIDCLPNQYEGIGSSGMSRLGTYKCQLVEGSVAHNIYKCGIIYERHRHRYEFNNKYCDAFVNKDAQFSGFNPETGLKEIFEITSNRFYVTCEFHPEFKSRPIKPHPLFVEFIAASLEVHK
ncbi:MAG: CTP synthase [Bacilli bacterium]